MYACPLGCMTFDKHHVQDSGWNFPAVHEQASASSNVTYSTRQYRSYLCVLHNSIWWYDDRMYVCGPVDVYHRTVL
jgi:hypothetical protein